MLSFGTSNQMPKHIPKTPNTIGFQNQGPEKLSDPLHMFSRKDAANLGRSRVVSMYF